MSLKPELSILVVNHHSGGMLRDCLASLRRDPLFGRCEIVVVDNASTDDSLRLAEDAFPDVTVFRMSGNLGFGAANNAGLARCRSSFVLMANPDTLLSQGTLEAVLELMREDPGLGLLGPRLTDPDGTLQHSIRNYPTVAREAFEALFLHRVAPRFTSRFADVVQDPAEYESERTADWVCGAVMFARREALASIGGFDEGFFLYAEEIDLAKRLTEAGWRVRYAPQATFVHLRGSYAVDPLLALENQRSKLRYFAKHSSMSGTLAFASVMFVRLALRAAAWWVASLRGGRRSRGRLPAVLGTLRRYPRMVLDYAITGRVAAFLGPEPLRKETT